MVLIFSMVTIFLVLIPELKPVIIGVLLGLDFFLLVNPLLSIYLNYQDLGDAIFSFIAVGLYLTIIGGALTMIGVGIYYFQLRKDKAPKASIASTVAPVPPPPSWGQDLYGPQTYQQPAQQAYPQSPQQQQYDYSYGQNQYPPQY